MSERRPFILLTRRREDSEELARALRERAADVLVLPCVRTEPLTDAQELAGLITSLDAADVLVLTSRAGAEAVAPFAPRARVAAVGPATAERARTLGLRVAFVPSRADAATLARQLPLPEGRVVLARSDLADVEAVEILRARGASVLEIVAYRTVPAIDGDPGALVSALEHRRVGILVASPSAVQALTRAVSPELLRRAGFVTIGPRTARTVREGIGADPIVAPDGDLADVLIAAASGREALVT